MAKAKTLLLTCNFNIKIFFNMDEDKSSFLYLPSNVASYRYVSNTLSHFKISNVASYRYVSNTLSHFKIPLAKPLNFCDPHNKLSYLSFTFLVPIII